MNSLPDLIREVAKPLAGSAGDYDSLLALVGDARFVLLGEASHGTHEFYRERAQVTKRLIQERDFNAVAVEADWPDAYRINRFVRGVSEDGDSVEALSGFKRFPQWMWRNADVLDFIGWLREHNDAQPSDGNKCGFYGLDLYSLHASIEAVLDYLSKVDPEAAHRARRHYSCFDHFGKEAETYGWATASGVAPSCEEEVLQELIALRLKTMEYLQRDGQVAADAYFCAEQNALIVRDAEQYYRNMFRREFSSWNQREPTHDGISRAIDEPSRQAAPKAFGAGQGCRLGTQLTLGRRACYANECAGRIESGSTGAGTFRESGGIDRLDHAQWHGHGGLRLGRPG